MITFLFPEQRNFIELQFILSRFCWQLFIVIFLWNIKLRLPLFQRSSCRKQLSILKQMCHIFSHHLASVVCKLFTFQASSPKPLGQLEPNLAGMFLGWSSTKLLFFVPVGYSTCLPGPIICSDWLKFQRSFSLKLMNWLNPNCKWMIIGISFTKFLFFMPIGS
jgi:hypothetical protein